MNNKSRILFLLFFPLILLAARAADGKTVIERMVKTMKEAPSLTIDFRIVDDGRSIPGRMILAGKNFTIRTDNGEYETWFDGKTQWTWSAATEEVNMSEPTSDELLESNPFLILNGVTANFISELLSSSNQSTTLNLVPKGDVYDNVKNVLLEVSNSSGLPEKLTITTNDRRVIMFEVTSTQSGKKLSSKFFRYDPSIHPDAEIIDLR